MPISKSCTFLVCLAHVDFAISRCSPSAPIRRTQHCFEAFNTLSPCSTRLFTAMPKRKRAAGVSTNTSVLREQPDECFDILGGGLTGADNLELPSPPVSDQTEGGSAEELVGTNGDGMVNKIIPMKRSLAGRREGIARDAGMASKVDRAPPVNSNYVPIPWKGRLGFACLNTYLRASNPPIFCSRTCRIDTILRHGIEGRKYVESLGLANARDLVKLIHWNERYGIKFFRISSEMFPFASHPVYGYSLEFAKDALAEAGKAAMEYGQRLSVHPGQYTQFGSPRKEVVESAMRDVEYHAQLLGYLGLTGQADKDAVMVLHLGGTFGDKEATLQRFRENYALLSPQVKARLVLENDDMCWSVHDLLPLCKELNIPLVLDWHHHNLVRDPSMREGSLDILKLIPEIKETWVQKGITQKQHYSEPGGGAITHKERRRHSARVVTLPPCEDTMDLMIEAKDKEQAVFELMRKFKLPGWEKIQDVIPHVREDKNEPGPKRRVVKAKKLKKGKKAHQKKKRAGGGKEGEMEEFERQVEEEPVLDPEPVIQPITEEEIGMGGVEGRVYWPEGKEDWLSPPKRVRIKKGERTVDGTEKGAEGDERKPRRVARRHKKAAIKPEAEGDGGEGIDEEAATAVLSSKRARGTKKASAPALVDDIITPLPPKVLRKRKPLGVKAGESGSEVTRALEALRRRKPAHR